MPSLTLADVWKVSDALFCRTQHNLSLPSWANVSEDKGQAVFDLLQQLNDWQMFNGVCACVCVCVYVYESAQAHTYTRAHTHTQTLLGCRSAASRVDTHSHTYSKP